MTTWLLPMVAPANPAKLAIRAWVCGGGVCLIRVWWVRFVQQQHDILMLRCFMRVLRVQACKVCWMSLQGSFDHAASQPTLSGLNTLNTQPVARRVKCIKTCFTESHNCVSHLSPALCSYGGLACHAVPPLSPPPPPHTAPLRKTSWCRGCGLVFRPAKLIEWCLGDHAACQPTMPSLHPWSGHLHKRSQKHTAAPGILTPSSLCIM